MFSRGSGRVHHITFGEPALRHTTSPMGDRPCKICYPLLPPGAGSAVLEIHFWQVLR